jgi:hypothetical protein
MPFLEAGGGDSAPHYILLGGAPLAKNGWNRRGGVLGQLYVSMCAFGLYGALYIVILENFML